MVVRRRLRRALLALGFHALALGGAYFFAASAQTGERGMLAKIATKSRALALNAEHEALVTERAVWERRVRLMNAAAVDRDLLDERARVVLDSAHRNDVVVLLGERR